MKDKIKSGVWPMIWTVTTVLCLIIQHNYTRESTTVDAAKTVYWVDSLVGGRIDSLQSLILNSEDLDRLEAMKEKDE